MRQRDKIERMSQFLHSDSVADDLRQRRDFIKKLRQRQLANGQDKCGLQNRKLGSQPSAAKRYLLVGRHAVSSIEFLSRKTSADRTHVYGSSETIFANAKLFPEPLEHRFAGSPRKWASQNRFLRARRLADKHDTAQHSSTRHGRRSHLRTASTVPQRADMLLQEETSLQLIRRFFHSKNKPSQRARSHFSRDPACTMFVRQPNISPYPNKEIGPWN